MDRRVLGALGAAAVCIGGWVVQRCVARKRRERRMKMLVHNVAKKHNIGSLTRACVAMGVEEIVTVSKSGKRDFANFGSFGTEKHIKFTHKYSIADAKAYLAEEDFQLVGVEIMDCAKPVVEYTALPFMWGLVRQPWRHDRVCLVMGNEGHGIHESVKEACDWFVYIPQYSQGTASMNVTTAAAIVMQQFAMSRGSAEASREGEKFVVAKPPDAKAQYEADPQAFDDVRRQRAERRAAAAAVDGDDDEPDAAWLDEE